MESGYGCRGSASCWARLALRRTASTENRQIMWADGRNGCQHPDASLPPQVSHPRRVPCQLVTARTAGKERAESPRGWACTSPTCAKAPAPRAHDAGRPVFVLRRVYSTPAKRPGQQPRRQMMQHACCVRRGSSRPNRQGQKGVAASPENVLSDVLHLVLRMARLGA